MQVLSHIAIIMDGNGRWAKARFLPRVEGHRRGVDALRRTVQAARKLGVKHLSVFAFSSENWGRPQDEVQALMRYFVAGLKKEAQPLAEAGVRLHVVGNLSAFDAELQSAIREAENITIDASAMTLNVLANYGGRWDIVQAAKTLCEQGEEISEATLEKHLSMPWAGPVDLMIRTGGEQRISNFILWQAAYAELFYTDTLWPDFSQEDLSQAMEWYATRERRFGLTSEQIKKAE